MFPHTDPRPLSRPPSLSFSPAPVPAACGGAGALPCVGFSLTCPFTLSTSLAGASFYARLSLPCPRFVSLCVPFFLLNPRPPEPALEMIYRPSPEQSSRPQVSSIPTPQLFITSLASIVEQVLRRLAPNAPLSRLAEPLFRDPPRFLAREFSLRRRFRAPLNRIFLL